ncbi:hypothetical protein CDL15_Pgr018208 [Punica granatum]|uniref:Uncharacterized protein n=1 Tax=Punica granatum TaxID=22663 RepID=A0A218WIC5_PUNGR|nr:hypothetical protein CDL15_Pgr018208 [Punica granatum]
MASEAITGLRGERAEPKWPIGDVAVDGIAAGRRQAHPVCSSAACAQRAYLEAPELPPRLVQHHHLHLPFFDHRHHLRPSITLQAKNKTQHPVQQMPHSRVKGKKTQRICNREGEREGTGTGKATHLGCSCFGVTGGISEKGDGDETEEDPMRRHHSRFLDGHGWES